MRKLEKARTKALELDMEAKKENKCVNAEANIDIKEIEVKYPKPPKKQEISRVPSKRGKKQKRKNGKK